MNAVEIEQAVSDLVAAPFDSESFPYAFLEAFGNKSTTIKKLKVDRSKKASTNHSDIEGGVLQRNNIHLLVCEEGEVGQALKALVDSPETTRRKCKYALATDGLSIEAENLVEGETLACDISKLDDHFGFFLPLAGITTVKEIRNNAFDIKATSRLNRLYVELLRHNPEWDTAERREEMNHFFARLIFCFFAEDTGIFRDGNLFTSTIEQMSDGTNTHEILTEVFRSMNIKLTDRMTEKVRPYADQFPYVNGGLFDGSPEAPRFTKIARSYLLHVGRLDWKQINPDIFGSMIQAVADDEERGALGMHYTSVPNILKVLNPLFLDDLRTKLEEAGDNKRKLLNLRNRMSRIRVFDPACGSGNFLVIAYKEMREIEAKINELRSEDDRRSDIPLTNFRGVELRHFSAEIARLALIIAEYQCDVVHRGQKLALLEFLPLNAKNWITCGNALRLDWLKICPPTGTGVKIAADDLFSTPLDQAEMDFENEGGETFICGNPPYKGGTEQSARQKADMAHIFAGLTKSWKSLDYVCGWFLKFASYSTSSASSCAFVCTNSIVQGEQVARLWPLILDKGQRIVFAHTSFKWANLAAHNAGVTVVVIGLELRGRNGRKATLFDLISENNVNRREVDNICPYLVPHEDLVIEAETNQMFGLVEMSNGNKPADGGHLILSKSEADQVVAGGPKAARFVRRFVGARDSIQGIGRFCIWVNDEEVEKAKKFPTITSRWEQVAQMRSESPKPLTQRGAITPHAFQQVRQNGNEVAFVVPRHSSESRSYLPISHFNKGVIVADGAFAVYDAPYWCFALLVSQIHLIWIATVCGKIKTDYRYSSTLGWNTFPVPVLTEQNKSDLGNAAKQILLVREEKFPSSLSDLYDPATMPQELIEAHEQNDETIERIYIGRRFKNDTERLEKLFEMYTKMTLKDAV